MLLLQVQNNYESQKDKIIKNLVSLAAFYLTLRHAIFIGSPNQFHGFER